jgi:hypothetical protein
MRTEKKDMFPYIPLQLYNHSIHKNVGSDNKHDNLHYQSVHWLADIGHRRLED